MKRRVETRAAYFLPKGLKIELQIEGKRFGLEHAMYVMGEVRYCRQGAFYKRYRCGIHFTDLPSNYAHKIAAFMGE